MYPSVLQIAIVFQSFFRADFEYSLPGAAVGPALDLIAASHHDSVQFIIINV
jgi:hypothetical protein